MQLLILFLQIMLHLFMWFIYFMYLFFVSDKIHSMQLILKIFFKKHFYYKITNKKKITFQINLMLCTTFFIYAVIYKMNFMWKQFLERMNFILDQCDVFQMCNHNHYMFFNIFSIFRSIQLYVLGYIISNRY